MRDMLADEKLFHDCQSRFDYNAAEASFEVEDSVPLSPESGLGFILFDDEVTRGSSLLAGLTLSLVTHRTARLKNSDLQRGRESAFAHP